MSRNRAFSNASGFSLIELSIILIVIGLIIIGTVSSFSLIRSTKIRGLISELRKYKQSVYHFMVVKGRFPGDIYNTGNFGLDAGYFYSEGDFVYPYNGTNSIYGTPVLSVVGPFVELYLERITDFEPKNTDKTNGRGKFSYLELGLNGALPRSKSEKSYFIYYKTYSKIQKDGYDRGIIGNYIVLDPDNEFIIDPKFSRDLDLKYDDGIYDTGKFRTICEGDDKDGYNSYENAINSESNCALSLIKTED